LAPMPIASDAMMTSVDAGVRRIIRTA
jgi:hypothetical protein